MALLTTKEVINKPGTVLNGQSTLTSGSATGSNTVSIPAGKIITSISVRVNQASTGSITGIQIGSITRFYSQGTTPFYIDITNTIVYLPHCETFYLNLSSGVGISVGMVSVNGNSLISSDLITVNYYTP